MGRLDSFSHYSVLYFILSHIVKTKGIILYIYLYAYGN